MQPDLDLDRAVLLFGDCRERLSILPEASVDACVTDPPYELGFMAKGWDRTGVAFDIRTWQAVLRVLKPGAHMLCFGGSRTYYRMAIAIEDAGFEVRDCLSWLYGTGFPKSKRLADDVGTALKPAWEPILLVRKPLEPGLGVVNNFREHGTGGLQIAASLVGPGRWPANVLLDEAAAAALDVQTGELKRGGDLREGGGGVDRAVVTALHLGPREAWSAYPDIGGASRFFYVAKTKGKERDLYCEHLPVHSGGEATGREDGSAGVANPRAGAGRGGGRRNFHPTVKPVNLLRYLSRLVTPAGGTVLDPFAGSASTAIAALVDGNRFIGVEQSDEYWAVSSARVIGAHDRPEVALSLLPPLRAT